MRVISPFSPAQATQSTSIDSPTADVQLMTQDTRSRPAAGSVGAMVGPDNERLAAMRKEYGSRERDGSPDLDVDWLDDGWLALVRKLDSDGETCGGGGA